MVNKKPDKPIDVKSPTPGLDDIATPEKKDEPKPQEHTGTQIIKLEIPKGLYIETIVIKNKEANQ